MDKLLALFRLAAFLGTSGAIFALGFVAVCRWLKWPSLTVTVYNPPGQFSTVSESELDAAG